MNNLLGIQKTERQRTVNREQKTARVKIITL